jgi:putative FmdB family regulatory protein
MPLYDFECEKCHHAFEAILRMDEPWDTLACPACGRKKVRKKVMPIRTNAWSSFLDGMEKRVNPHKFK